MESKQVDLADMDALIHSDVWGEFTLVSLGWKIRRIMEGVVSGLLFFIEVFIVSIIVMGVKWLA